MPRRLLPLFAVLLLAAGAARADSLYLNAEGTVFATADRAWLKVGSVFFELRFDTKEIFHFAQALHGRRVYVSGPLDVRADPQKSPEIRVDTLTRNPREGFTYFSPRWGRGIFVGPGMHPSVVGERAQEFRAGAAGTSTTEQQP